jgi:hypothetical protein
MHADLDIITDYDTPSDGMEGSYPDRNEQLELAWIEFLPTHGYALDNC